jgi:hypothetical protein
MNSWYEDRKEIAKEAHVKSHKHVLVSCKSALEKDLFKSIFSWENAHRSSTEGGKDKEKDCNSEPNVSFVINFKDVCFISDNTLLVCTYPCDVSKESN